MKESFAKIAFRDLKNSDDASWHIAKREFDHEFYQVCRGNMMEELEELLKENSSLHTEIVLSKDESKILDLELKRRYLDFKTISLRQNISDMNVKIRNHK